MNKKTKQKHSVINIGSSVDYPINFYVKKVCKLLNLKKYIVIYDIKKPIGTFRKLLDNTVAKNYGWQPKISLEEGMKRTIKSLDSKKFF
jgi:GDP-L-fucose synthase